MNMAVGSQHPDAPDRSHAFHVAVLLEHFECFVGLDLIGQDSRDGQRGADRKPAIRLAGEREDLPIGGQRLLVVMQIVGVVVAPAEPCQFVSRIKFHRRLQVGLRLLAVLQKRMSLAAQVNRFAGLAGNVGGPGREVLATRTVRSIRAICGPGKARASE